MDLDAVKNGVQACKNFASSIKNCYRFVFDHPFIFALGFILIIFYRFLPSLLAYLISSSPILVCTVVLLRTLLSFGSHHQVSRIESKRTVKARAIDDDNTIVSRSFSFSAETCSRKKWDNRDRASDGKVTFSPTHNDLGGTRGRSSKVQKKNTQMGDIETQQSDKNSTLCSRGSLSDAPTDDALQVLDDMHSLLESKPVPSDGLEVASDDTERSIDGSADSDEDENNGEGEGKVGEDNSNNSAVTWTEDDQKNLMDLGTSELERNQRLESLIAKRRLRKSFGRLPEKNLIDFDSNDPPVQFPSISTIKTNPFDIPFESNEVEGLPPIPGSAPSILVPRRNPFDIPYDPLEERPNLTGDSFHQEFMAILQKDMFCRHESFSLGSSFVGVPRHDEFDAKFSNYFATEGMPLQGPGYPALQGVLVEENKYKVPSVTETEFVPSVGAQSGLEKPIEETMIQKDHSSVPYILKRQSSEAVVSLETIEDEKCDVGLIEADDERAEKDLGSKSDVVNETQSDPPSQMNEKISNMNINIGFRSKDPDPKKGDSTEITANAMKLSSLKKDSDVKSSAEDDKTEEPLYDSSPSEIEKRTIEESFFCMDKEVALSCTTSSADSDLVVEVSEIGSPHVERTISCTDQSNAPLNVNGKTEIGSGNKDTVEEDDSKSTEVIKIIKCNVVEEVLGDKHESNDSYTASMEQEPSAEQVQMSSESDSLPMNKSKEQVVINQIPSSINNEEIHAEVH